MNDLQLNGTKIMHHVRALQAWRQGDNPYPIQVEISPTNRCNHKCVFCAYDHIPRAKPRYLDMAQLERALKELWGLGTKALFYSGEGEPLLHKGLPDIVEKAAGLGFSQALNTNGVLMRGQRLERILPALDWIRISVNAATPDVYKSVHRCHPSDHNRVLANIAAMADLSARQGLPVTIGVQMVYMGQPTDGLYEMVHQLREVGAAYFSLKRFNQHPLIPLRDFTVPVEQFQALSNLATKNFQVTLRSNIDIDTAKRRYTHCYGMDFYAEIISNGEVYSCGPHLQNPVFCYGNIADSTFRELWSPENRAALHRRIHALGPLDDICMPHCRIHAINNFLWSLRHPPSHVNFI